MTYNRKGPHSGKMRRIARLVYYCEILILRAKAKRNHVRAEHMEKQRARLVDAAVTIGI